MSTVWTPRVMNRYRSDISEFEKYNALSSMAERVWKGRESIIKYY
jgi:hypothetical protein